MLNKLKKFIPISIKRALSRINQRTVVRWEKRKIYLRMKKKHEKLVFKIKGKERIKILFLVIHKSVWKVDPVFRKMLDNPFFDPVIVVCPYIIHGEDRMWEEMHECIAYFNSKGYPIHSTYNNEKNHWIGLDELEPDIIFFTNPHDLTRKEYYDHAYLNYLTCYVPYHHEVCSYGEGQDQYNQKFHNAMWRIFASHNESFELFKITAQTKANNVRVTGYPAIEDLMLCKDNEIKIKKAWNSDDDRLKAIWAPHHTIDDPSLPYSNFIEYAYKFMDLAKEYKHKIVWCFKPHPMLKAKLYKHPDWGIEKTNEFYKFWELNSFSQISEGEYFELFVSSNFMIHDSGSFLAEYLYSKHPVMYLMSKKNNQQFYNAFGQKALNSCELGYEFTDVIKFIENMVAGNKNIKKEHFNFIDKEVKTYFDISPSDKIIQIILKDVKGS
jgi:hypothetical protein